VKAYDERAILMEMPYELRHGILEHTYRDIIVKVPLFDVNGDGKVCGGGLYRIRKWAS
jgi:hypothetical protein